MVPHSAFAAVGTQQSAASPEAESNNDARNSNRSSSASNSSDKDSWLSEVGAEASRGDVDAVQRAE